MQIHKFSAFTLLFWAACLSTSVASTITYTVEKNAHSHNDYVRANPFYLAYNCHFASIEADVFLVDGELYVAHKLQEIDKSKTLRKLYLEPIKEKMKLNGNKIYADGKPLQLLIDLKTNNPETKQALQNILTEYKDCFDVLHNPCAVQVVWTGNTPMPGEFNTYAPWIKFDGVYPAIYTKDQLKRIAMVSLSLKTITKWRAKEDMSDQDYEKVLEVIRTVHAIGKPIRFWSVPDSPGAWDFFMKNEVDFLNTDHPQELANYLQK